MPRASRPEPAIAVQAPPDRSLALQPPPGNPRFPLLDALRGVAAVCILLTHTAGVTGFNTANPLGALTARLDFGVAIFFVLSGFLLYRPFVAARLEGRPPIRWRDYARRRALRIVPAYWVALTVLAAWPGLVAFWDGPWWRSYTFTQVYWLDSTVQGIFPAWTLCIEVSFYLALPLIAGAIAAFVARRSRAAQLRIELWVLAGLALASLALRTALQAAGGFYIAQNTVLCFMDWFCAGMALAVLSVAWRGREHESRVLRLIVRRPWAPWALSAVAFCVMATTFGLPRGFFLVFNDLNYFGEHVVYVLCAVLLLLPAVFGDWAGGWPRRLLARRELAWLGLISYGVFLYHGPLVLALHQHGADGWLPGSRYLSLSLVSLAAAAACAAASYYLVERPALRFKDGWAGAWRGSRWASRRSAARASVGA